MRQFCQYHHEWYFINIRCSSHIWTFEETLYISVCVAWILPAITTADKSKRYFLVGKCLCNIAPQGGNCHLPSRPVAHLSASLKCIDSATSKWLKAIGRDENIKPHNTVQQYYQIMRWNHTECNLKDDLLIILHVNVTTKI